MSDNETNETLGDALKKNRKVRKVELKMDIYVPEWVLIGYAKMGFSANEQEALKKGEEEMLNGMKAFASVCLHGMLPMITFTEECAKQAEEEINRIADKLGG